VPPQTAFEIFKTRPEIYAAILGPNGDVAAYSSAYPLKREWAEAFIAGDITEPDLTPSMLLTRQDGLDGSSVYVGSVVVVSQNDPLTKAILLASLLSWRVRQLKAASVKRLSAFMTPVAEQGERMIRFIGAKQLNDGTNRKDGYPVYGRAITPGFLSRATATMERCLNSRVVQMNCDFTPGLNHPRPVQDVRESLVKKTARPWAVVAFDKLLNAKEPAPSTYASLREKVSSAFDGMSDFFDAQWIANLGVSLVLLALTTAALLAVDTLIEVEHLSFAYTLPILLIAVRYGKSLAAIASVASSLIAAFYFYPPKFSILIDDPMHVAELACFCAMALMISNYVGERGSSEALAH